MGSDRSGRKTPPPLPVLIVVGDRRYKNYLEMWEKLDALVKVLGKVRVFTGGNYTNERGEYWPKENGAYVGADYGAYTWALKRRYEVTVFHAEWDDYGNKAGPVRNSKMILDCAGPDAYLVAFDGGGPGTADALKKAKKVLKAKRIRVIDVKEDV